jgi:hypothetical protein
MRDSLLKAPKYYFFDNGRPVAMIEVKWSDDNWAKNFSYYEGFFQKIKKIQLVGKLDREKTLDAYSEIRSAAKWLTQFKFEF